MWIFLGGLGVAAKTRGGLIKTSVSLEPDLLAAVDRYRVERIHFSRSMAIRVLLAQALVSRGIISDSLVGRALTGLLP